jgi:hypothetical protein
MNLEQPETITYTPSQSGEIPPVLDAIQMQVQIEELNIHGDPGDVDRRFIDGYTRGIAYTMAVTDPFCEEPADPNLWKQCASAHDAGPHNTRPFPRMRAWLDYFQRAAADLAREL